MEALATKSEITEGKFLTFDLGEEVFGIEIIKVKEIIGIMDITTIPQTPEYMKGVINLRGKVIPVIDLRLKFSMQEEKHTEKTCVIVVEIAAGNNMSLQIGIIVDSVSEVLSIEGEDIEGTPNFEQGIDTTFIMGLGKTRGKIILLLDIEGVLSSEELGEVEQLAKG